MFSALFKILPDGISKSLTAIYYKTKLIGAQGSHSLAKHIKMSAMSVKILPALQDNYMYLVIDDKTKEAAIVDPVQPQTVLSAVEEEQVNLNCVLTTHHHWDHAGGNNELANAKKGITVIGGDDRVDALTKKVQHGDKFNIGSLEVKCLHTPCHTKGHICYAIGLPGQEPEAVFTGDTLFIGGCGKFFEGDAQQMHSNLIEKLGSLPDDCKVYCGHEYTVQNLKFAKMIEPDNNDLLKKLEWAEAARKDQQPTVPSTIGTEKLYNPFMRVTVQGIQHLFGKDNNAVETMKDLRQKKDVTKVV
uniref:hydroxyacylglutathione hydrolase n=1 Tax=Riptortus pedestris TaxID=329032 RepID=R4WDB9_RIPPE|nr:hydroxyacylglutathione hydrolase [Riptortus pedestris]